MSGSQAALNAPTGCVAVPKHLLGGLAVHQGLCGDGVLRCLEYCRKAVGWSLGGAASCKEAVNRRCCPTHPDGEGSDPNLDTGTALELSQWSDLGEIGIRQMRDQHSC